MTQRDEYQVGWWGKLDVSEGQTIQWEIGSLQLALERLPNEWQLAYEWGDEVDPTTGEWSQKITNTSIDELNYPTVERYVVDQTDEILHIMPALADRPVITRPLKPFFVSPGDRITVYVSSPLWVSIAAGDPPRKLRELPIYRPSDTWFGPSTMEGELCYASRTHGNLNLENVPVHSHRAITQVAVHNQADTQLQIERLNLPVPYLSLFETENGILWTEAVAMVRTRNSDMAAFQVEKGPVEAVTGARLIIDPRQQPSQNMIIRAFGVLFR